MTVNYEIQEFGVDGAESECARNAAALHATLLGHSPLVLMGAEFVEEFYYTVLPAESRICGAIACVDGVPAGFIVATADPNGFMSSAVKKHWAHICWILLKSLLRNPGRIFAIKEAWQIQSNVQASDYGPDVGELLSFGVLPEFRTRRFLKTEELYIASDLLKIAVRQLQELGKKRLRAIVDKDNIEAQLFYRANGWRVGLKTVKGWRVPTMEFLVDVGNSSDGSETKAT